MPIMDGLEATKRIRQLTKEKGPRIVILTGNSNHEFVKKANQIGVDQVYLKPLNLDNLAHELLLTNFID